MTKLLERAFDRVRAYSPEAQDDIARVLLRLTGEDGDISQLASDEEASLEASLAEAERGEFASDELVREIWAKHGL